MFQTRHSPETRVSETGFMFQVLFMPQQDALGGQTWFQAASGARP